MKTTAPCCLIVILFFTGGRIDASENLLLNPQFSFHSFENSRNGTAASFKSGSIPCWNQNRYGDVEVYRSSRAPGVRPNRPTEGVAVIHPGRRLTQFVLLADVGLEHGERVSLQVRGEQKQKESLRVSLHCMRLDNEPGNWKAPNDSRDFPKHSRGELVRGPSYTKVADAAGQFEVRVEDCEIIGAFTESPRVSNDQPNTVGILVEFENQSADQDVWIYCPKLSRGANAAEEFVVSRPLPTHYRGIPRTIQKLWRGEPLHIIVMGSSIDRGSANPRQFLYDEDPKSPTFKTPKVSTTDFRGELVGHPEWDEYIGWWQHYFMYGGRLRQRLMEKFDYPIDRLLLNTMACDGSCISESHSALADYASLSIRPDPGLNGHRAGKSWEELYPALFARPEGPRPDLVIFGSGANERIDGADEIACFEGAIRWFQRNYPDTEFLFCMWQNRDSYAQGVGYLMELSQRYQIPYIDLARAMSLTTRYCNSFALVPDDGHPQAAAHFLWSNQLEKAFDAADSIEPGRVQRQLPARLNNYTIGWEGEVSTYSAGDGRLSKSTAFLMDDVAINVWADGKGNQGGLQFRVDGVESNNSRRLPMRGRDLRNSSFAIGRLSMGDRHIVEVVGEQARIVAVDSKRVLGRSWVGVESGQWTKPGAAVDLESAWGYPFGRMAVTLEPGQSASIGMVATDISVAWSDRKDGGVLIVEVDGKSSFRSDTNRPVQLSDGKIIFGENRKGVTRLPFGHHQLRVAAEQGPVTLIGAFCYDTRANRDNERILRGIASPGDVLKFEPAFRASPIVITSSGLSVKESDVTRNGVTFAGSSSGTYEVIGE